MKKCFACQEQKPATTEYFYRSKAHGGLYPYCKPCVKTKQEEQSRRWQESRESITKKGCSRCRKVRPVEDFSKNKNTKSGYESHCKYCDAARYGREYTPPVPIRDGYKCCPQCKRERPHTTEYFYHNKSTTSGLDSICKDCAKNNAKIYRTEYTQEQQRQARFQEPIKTCPDCERELSRTSRYFYIDKNKRDGLSSNCRKCIQCRTRKWTKKNPERRKAQHVVDKQRRRTRKQSVPHDFTADDWQAAISHFNGCCAVCERPLNGIFHTAAADHWIPLSSPDCPGHVKTNIVPLCHGTGSCNLSKGSNDPQEWLIQQFGKRTAAKILKRIERYFKQVGG